MGRAPRRRPQGHDVSFWEGYQQRRRRGTRWPLDWKYSARIYLGLIPATLLVGLSTGVRLLRQEGAWQDVLGMALIASTIATGAAIIRWLQLPVDPDARARLLAEHDEKRLERLWPDLRVDFAAHRGQWRWYLREAVGILLIAAMYFGLGVFREVVVEERPLRAAFGTGAAVVAFVFAVGIYVLLLSWASSSGATEEGGVADSSSPRRPPTPESERAHRINAELEELREGLKAPRTALRQETET